MKKTIAFILALTTLLSLFCISVSAVSVIRQNTSSSPVSTNASNGNLPATLSSVNTNTSCFFNIQASSDYYIKNAKLYIKKPGQSSFYNVYSETPSGYLRYTSTKQSVGSTAGTLYYYWSLKMTNGSSRTLATSYITVNSTTTNSTVEMRQNVSSSPVTCNASNGSLPSSVSTASANASYYFNIQTDNSCMVKTAKLYMKKPGQSSYYNVYSETPSGYLRYTSTKQSVGSTAGTLYYYWSLKMTDGSSRTLATSYITVNATTTPSSTNQDIISDSEIASKAASAGISSASNAYYALQSINTKYGATLTSNKTGTNVFLFEGCGNDSNANLRMNAMCVVVKDGTIVYINRNSSTIPDYPFDGYTNNNDNNVPTLKSGIYTFSTLNHRGNYAALNVNNAKVVRFKSSNNYYDGTSAGINVHRRGSNNRIYSTLPNSSGCILIGKAGTGSSSEYAQFIKALGIVGSNATGNTKYSTYITGKIVIDRSYGANYLSAVGYSASAILALQ